jgi:hypothetical protein
MLFYSTLSLLLNQVILVVPFQAPFRMYSLYFNGYVFIYILYLDNSKINVSRKTKIFYNFERKE